MINLKFMKIVFAIAIPVAIQELIFSSNALLDNFMISKLGIEAVAAAGSANRFMEIFILSLIGISITNGAFTSQFNSQKGSKAKEGFTKSISINLFLGALISLIFISIYFTMREYIVAYFSSDLLVQKSIKDYLNVCIFCSIPLTISFAIITSLKSMKKIYFPLLSAIFCVLTNFLLNLSLIEGRYGFPKMGIKGAAIATLSSEILTSLILILGVYILQYPIIPTFKSVSSISKSFVKKYLKLAGPMTFNFLSWSISQYMIHGIIGKLGKNELAAFGIIAPIEIIFIHLFMGFSSAGRILVGKELGDSNFDEAYKKVKEISVITFITSFTMGIVIYCNSTNISNLYNISTIVMQNVDVALRIFAFTLWIAALTRVLFGSLTSGGDFFFISSIGVLFSWLVTIPSVFIGYYIFNWNFIEIYLSIKMASIIFILALSLRYRSKKWMTNLTEQ